MPTGGVITITATNVEQRAPGIVPLPAGNYVKIEVADRGVGMSQELMSRIFDPFITTKQRGSGLGLASAYSIIRNHQGHISVRSTLGKGSVFTFFLPAQQTNIDSCPPNLETPAVPESLRVLLMDDEDQVRTMLAEMLQELGHTVDAVDNSEEAIAYYRQQLAVHTSYDLVILDLTIPGGLGGKDTLQRLRELNPNIRAIATSGYSIDPVMANYTQFGFVGCLTKPYRLQELHAVLAALYPLKS
jgi:CheY-like chemotaxis protein